MKRRFTVASCILLALALVASGCAKKTEKKAEKKEETEYATTTLGDKAKDYLEASDQETGGSKIVIKDAILTAPGYVVIHSDAGGAPGPSIEASKLLQPGDHTDLVIEFMQPLTKDQTVYPMLHFENNGNTTYDGVDVDLPVKDAAGKVIFVPIKLEIKK